MPNSDARMVHGLSIAVLVLSAFALAGCLFALLFLGIGGAALVNPDIAGSAAAGLSSNPDVLNELEASNLSSGDVFNLAVLGVGVTGAFVIWGMACSLVALVASILGMRNYDKPQQLGSAFGWAIAGAVTSFLTGNIISTVLLIISAVYIDKVRKAALPQ